MSRNCIKNSDFGLWSSFQILNNDNTNKSGSAGNG